MDAFAPKAQAGHRAPSLTPYPPKEPSHGTPHRTLHPARSVRKAGRPHRRQRRDGTRHGDAARRCGSRPRPAGAERPQRRGGDHDDPRERTEDDRVAPVARAVVAVVCGRPRRDAARRRGTDRHLHRERRRHEPAGPAGHLRRFRAAGRHQPPGPRRTDRAPDAVAPGRSCPRHAADQRRRRPGRDQMGRPELGAVLRQHGRLLSVEDRVRPVRTRARSPQPRGGVGHHREPVAPRCRTPVSHPRTSSPRGPRSDDPSPCAHVDSSRCSRASACSVPRKAPRNPR